MLTPVSLKFSTVLCLLNLQISFRPSVGAHVSYEDGYRVNTEFSGNQAGVGIHVHSISRDLDKNRYLVVDSSNSTLVGITLPLSQESGVKAIAGTGEPGYKDGPATSAKFHHPQNAVIDAEGNIYVADSRNAAIRKISDGRVTTIAGGSSIGFADGDGEDARFSTDIELYLDTTICDLIVADRGNNALRKIRLDVRCCPSPWDDESNVASSSDRKFLYGIAAGAAATIVLSVIVCHWMLLKTWSMKVLQTFWENAKEVVLEIWGAFSNLLERFRPEAAPEQAGLLSNEAGNEQAGQVPPLIDFSDHPAEQKDLTDAGDSWLSISSAEGSQGGPTYPEDAGLISGLSFGQRALTVPTMITPDFIPGVRPDVDLIEDPSAGISLTVSESSEDYDDR